MRCFEHDPEKWQASRRDHAAYQFPGLLRYRPFPVIPDGRLLGKNDYIRNSERDYVLKSRTDLMFHSKYDQQLAKNYQHAENKATRLTYFFALPEPAK